MAKLGIGAKEKPKNKEQHDEQVKSGLTYLHQQEKALDKDGNKALTQEEANKVAANSAYNRNAGFGASGDKKANL